MKLILAIVRPEKVNDVLEALFRADIRGLTVTPAQGHRGEIEEVETYRGTRVKMGLVEKVRVEIGVSDHFEQWTIEAIVGAARTGEVGDGKIFVTEIGHVLRIRTGEVGSEAVTPVGQELDEFEGLTPTRVLG